MMKNRRVQGYTLIEVIVVLLILSILIALLIPAVQYAREAARRMTCANNLKQLGMSLGNYEASFLVYPQGANGGLYSAQVMLLPFFDQLNLYNSINFAAAGPLGGFAQGQCNQTIAQTSLSIFNCPSDPNANTYCTTSYGWNGGYGMQARASIGAFGSAAIPNLGYINGASITDGLSNTSAASEWKIGNFNSSDDSTVVFKVKINKGEKYSDFIQSCNEADRSTTQFGSWLKDASWYTGVYGSTVLNFNSLPNSHTCWYGYSLDYGNWPCGSYHTNGANILYFDNHVQFTSSHISLQMLQGISTTAGNESL